MVGGELFVELFVHPESEEEDCTRHHLKVEVRTDCIVVHTGFGDVRTQLLELDGLGLPFETP